MIVKFLCVIVIFSLFSGSAVSLLELRTNKTTGKRNGTDGLSLSSKQQSDV